MESTLSLLLFLNSPLAVVFQPWRHQTLRSCKGLRNSFLCDSSQHLSESIHVTDVWSELLIALGPEGGPVSLAKPPPPVLLYRRRPSQLRIIGKWSLLQRSFQTFHKMSITSSGSTILRSMAEYVP